MAMMNVFKTVPLKFLSISGRINLFSNNKCCLSSCKAHLTMRTAYFHCDDKENKISIKLLFDSEKSLVKKTLSFERRFTDTVENFLDRLNCRVHDIINKRIAKKKFLNNPVLHAESHFLLNNELIGAETVLGDLMTEEKCKNLKLRILENDYQVVLNVPMVIELTLPKIIRVGCPVIPKKLVTKSTTFSQFSWYVMRDKKNWICCSTGYSYTPKEEDINCKLKILCLPKNESQVGPEYVVTSDYPVMKFTSAHLIQSRQKQTGSQTGENEIRIVTYNILADAYTGTKEAKSFLFKYCDPEVLDWNYRMGLLLLELQGYNADIICLQEVEKKVFSCCLTPFLTDKGFGGYYSQKDNNSREGCALYYNKKKFDLVAEHHYFLSDEFMNNSLFDTYRQQIENNKKLMDRINGTSTLVQMVILKDGQKFLVVGNTHLYFHPDADHIRLLQGIVSFTILHQKIKELKEKYPEADVSLVWCGDFNSTPDCGIYKFLTQGSVDTNEEDWKSCPDEVINYISFSNPLNMQSACGTPLFTNYTEAFKACLDYIYYQTDKLEVKSYVPLPSEKELSLETALPSSFFPSDHVALIADLKWITSC